MGNLGKVFGDNLRLVRRSRGLSQAALAEAADLSLETIGKLERATVAPSFDSIEALAKALKVPPLALFGVKTLDGVKGTERARHLLAIERILGGLSDAELRRAAKVLAALIAD